VARCAVIAGDGVASRICALIADLPLMLVEVPPTFSGAVGVADTDLRHLTQPATNTLGCE